MCFKKGAQFKVPSVPAPLQASLRDANNLFREKQKLAAEQKEDDAANTQAGPISYVAAVTNKVSPKALVSGVYISLKDPISKEGEPAFILTEDEMRETLDNCKWLIVLKFSQKRPSIEQIKEYIDTNWDLKESPVLGIMNNRNVLVTTFS